MPIIIGICGPSAAGKTYLANYIKEYFSGRVSIISYDAYCRDFISNAKKKVDVSKVNYDSPDAYEGELLFKDLKKAKEGKDINCPIYDFSTHTRLKETKLIKNNDIIIVEGILIYQVKEIIPLLDYKVFITAKEKLRFKRRSDRDIMERGRTLESVKYQWNNTVEPSRHIYIDTVQDIADMIIHNSGSKGIEKEAKPLIKKINELLNNN